MIRAIRNLEDEKIEKMQLVDEVLDRAVIILNRHLSGWTADKKTKKIVKNLSKEVRDYVHTQYMGEIIFPNEMMEIERIIKNISKKAV
jgi:hypothetical protein